MISPQARGRAVAAFGAILLSLSNLAPAFSGFTVQAGAFASAQNAERARAELEAREISPVFIIESGEHRILAVGGFQNYLDAYLTKTKLEEVLETELTVRPMDTVPVEEATDPLSMIPPYFRNAAGNASELPVKSLRGDATYTALEALDTGAEGKAAYAEALRAELPKTNDADPLKGYILVNLGIVEIINKDYDKALQHLEPVAHGEVASAAAHRVMAMRRVAWIVHQKGDRLAAYHAYRHLEKFAHTENLRSMCKVECAGLLMELAESGKGTHDEVRREIAKILTEIPETNIKQRAVAELMESETWTRQPNRDPLKSAQAGEALIEKYTAMNSKLVEREIATAHYQTGFRYLDLGDLERARYHFNKVVMEFPDNIEKFQGLTPQVQAMIGLSHIANREGDWPLTQRIIRDAAELYPDSELGRGIQKDDPGFLQRVEPSADINGEVLK